ncbi:MAG: hypothetical protein ACOCX2_00370 [Armatimonadota bacterium]
MRFCRTFALLTALIGTMLTAAVSAMAADTAFRYNTAQRVINACVLAVDVDPDPDDVSYEAATPWIFEGMRRPNLTPDDWVFENPLAGGTVVPGRTPDEVLVRGTPQYWTVELTDESATRLVGMDIIYLSASTLELTPQQQDGLRAAVEAGAVLWVDSAIDPDDPAVVTEVLDFPWLMAEGATNVFDYVDADNYALDAIDERNGLLQDPHPLNSSAVARLGNWPNRADYDATAYTTGHYLVETELDPNFRTIVENVAYDDDGNEVDSWPWAVAMQYGSGNVLVTTGGVGRDVVEWLLEGDTDEADFRPSPNFLQAPDVKLALNAVQWKDRWQQARETPRAAATSVARAPFPLDVVWQYPDSTDDPGAAGAPVPPVIGSVVSTPVYDRSMVYAVSLPASLPDIDDVPGYLMAFDMRPEQDRDGDTQFDDGVPDRAFGSSYDLIWYATLPENATTRYSSPTLTSYVDPGGDLADYDDDTTYPQAVLISYVDTATGEGWVDCYDASVSGGGTLLWRREIPAFSASAQVVALSTPIVHKGYVYVLASEYDVALGANHRDSTYGRAHCFELDFQWDETEPWTTEASWWVYPSEQVNLDGIGTDLTDTEPQRSLPPFHNPNWLAESGVYAGGRTDLPPAPGAIPVVHGVGNSVDGEDVDALLTFGTPVSYEWDGGNIEIDTSLGGSQYPLVPAPLREDDFRPAKPGIPSGLPATMPWGIGLNHDYFKIRTNQDVASVTGIEGELTAADVDQYDTTLGEPYIWFSAASVREAIIEEVAASGGVNPLEAQLGLDVNVNYNGLPDAEPHRIPGPVRWKRTFERGEPINQPGAMGADAIAVTSGRPIDYDLTGNPGGSGGVAELDAASGATRWSYDPSRRMPGRSANASGESTTAAAFDDETIIVGESAVDYDPAAPSSVSSVIGLNRQMDVQIDLRTDAAGTYVHEGEYPVEVSIAWWNIASGLWEYPVLSSASYTVDPWLGRIMFSAASAANLIDEDGSELGISAYGRTLRVEWADGTFEDHIVPDIERFHHTPDYIRLRHRPYDATSVTITRPDGTPVSGADSISAAQDFGEPDDVRPAILDGWVDLSLAVDADGVSVEPGDELLVSYIGWSEAEGDWIGIPDPSRNIAEERHQRAVEFGPSLSSPAVAGDTVHLGTQGRDADMDAVFDGPDEAKTMLSLIWNKATGFARSGRSQPAYPQAGFGGGIPVVSGAPSITEDRVFVGSRMMSAPDATGIGPGYVSALAPWRVLLCDSNRIVETTGSEPGWVCTGTSSPQRTQDYIGEDVQRPFSRPAKATRLTTGNILVVDSGNHRVVEIDRAGRVVWPLDGRGYEYYTSPDNNDLKLSRPADAHRYYEVEGGRPHWITVVADTGNGRVVEIDTTFHNPDTGVLDGRQRHDVRVLTPTYVRGPNGAQRVRYISAAPIRDPRNDTVLGYLCAASNLNQLLVVTASEDNRLVNPFASVSVDNANATAGSTWRHWAWLYDADPSDTDNVSNQPLQFENIKHVDVQRIGGTIHVAVTCSRYVGRSGEPPHPLADDGAGVFEFEIDVSSADPALWELSGFDAGWASDDPHWTFVGADYRGRPMTTITTDAGDFDKRWYPVSSQRLSSDTVLITNSLTQIENATYANIGAGVRNAVLGSHIFEVMTDASGHHLDADRSVPAPGEMWIDPFTQPAHAEISR